MWLFFGGAALFFGAAVAMHRSAATISEAYQLHYAMGVGTGVIFAAVLLVALLLSQVSTTPTRRRGLVVATTLGYGLAVWKYFFRVAVHGLAAWPRVTATYVAVAAGAWPSCAYWRSWYTRSPSSSQAS